MEDCHGKPWHSSLLLKTDHFLSNSTLETILGPRGALPACLQGSGLLPQYLAFLSQLSLSSLGADDELGKGEWRLQPGLLLPSPGSEAARKPRDDFFRGSSKPGHRAPLVHVFLQPGRGKRWGTGGERPSEGARPRGAAWLGLAMPREDLSVGPLVTPSKV